MNLTMFKRLATDVAPPIAALLAFVAIALAISAATGDDRSHPCCFSIGANPFTPDLNPTFPRDQ